MKRRDLLVLACASAMLPGWMEAEAAGAARQPGTMRDRTTGRAANEAGIWQAHHEGVLGTSLEVAVRAPSRATARRVEAAVHAEFDRQSALLSAWDAESEFSRWQRTRGIAVPVSPELLETLLRFDYWRAETGGALNASAEAAAVLWRDASFAGKTPGAAELTAAASAMQEPHWKVDAATMTATHLTGTPLALASFVKSRISAAAADAAMRAGATGVMLNVGGDIVTRGRMVQRVDVANPKADAENDAPLDTVVLEDRAIATSGGYRRGFSVGGERLSHLIDLRTGVPVSEVLSSTVIARDAETAGALATALSVLTPGDSAEVARRYPDAEYLLVLRDGKQVQSGGWGRYQEPRMMRASYRVGLDASGTAMVPAAGDAAWNQSFELLVKLDLPRIDDPRYRRPFVAVWIEDENKFPVRTLALWFQKPKWLPELKTWYRDDRVRNLSEGTDLSTTISSATRGPGSYTLKWDGKDNEGKLVKAGKYTVCVEASREHGGYGMVRHAMEFGGQAAGVVLPEQPEIGAVGLEWRKR